MSSMVGPQQPISTLTGKSDRIVENNMSSASQNRMGKRKVLIIPVPLRCANDPLFTSGRPVTHQD